MVGGQGFLAEDVEPGAGEPSGAERLPEGVLVHDGGARGVDKDRAGLHEPDQLAAHQAFRGREGPDVDRHEVGAGHEVGEGERRDAVLAGPVGGEPGAPGAYLHSEGLGHFGHTRSDGAQPDDP